MDRRARSSLIAVGAAGLNHSELLGMDIDSEGPIRQYVPLNQRALGHDQDRHPDNVVSELLATQIVAAADRPAIDEALTCAGAGPFDHVLPTLTSAAELDAKWAAEMARLGEDGLPNSSSDSQPASPGPSMAELRETNGHTAVETAAEAVEVLLEDWSTGMQGESQAHVDGLGDALDTLEAHGYGPGTESGISCAGPESVPATAQCTVDFDDVRLEVTTSAAGSFGWFVESVRAESP